jgi:hypothetical protein
VNKEEKNQAKLPNPRPSESPTAERGQKTLSRRKRWFIIENKLGVNDIIALFALLISALGLIYQHRALVASEIELNTKIHDVRELSERIENETRIRLDDQKLAQAVEREFLDLTGKIMFTSLALRHHDTMFDQEADYALSLALESSLRLEETPDYERARIREDIVATADMTRALALEKSKYEQKIEEQIEELQKIIVSVEGRVLSLDELTDIGITIKGVLGPKLLSLAKEYEEAIKGPFAKRTGYQKFLEAFMAEREDAYKQGEKTR